MVVMPGGGLGAQNLSQVKLGGFSLSYSAGFAAKIFQEGGCG